MKLARGWVVFVLYAACAEPGQESRTDAALEDGGVSGSDAGASLDAGGSGDDARVASSDAGACPGAGGWPAGDHELSIAHDGATHRFLVHIPITTPPGAPVPIVLFFHGGGGTPETQEETVGMLEAADRHGFVLVRGQGHPLSSGMGYAWNAGACCGTASELAADVDHVGAVRAMLDQLEARVCADRDRVFATGHSNGGMFAYRLACELADRIAAVAPNAAFLTNEDLDDGGRLLFACNPSRPVSVLHLHGMADDCAPFDGGSSGLDPATRPPVSHGIDAFRAANGCGASSRVSYAQGAARCETWDCNEGAEVTLCTVAGAGHVWPGSTRYPAVTQMRCGGDVTTDLIANEAIWAFFARHPRVDRFAEVRTILERAVTDGEVPGYAFVLRNASEVPLLEMAGGDYTLDQTIPLDSAIKPVTSTVILSLVADGTLALGDSLGGRLGWTGPEAAVTVEQLLAFASGFDGDAACITPPPGLRPDGTLLVPPDRAPLSACAESIRSAGLLGTPGTELRYGASHQLLLALVAETATGRGWNELFRERVLDRVGLSESDLRYTNNRVAASAAGEAPAFAAIYRALGLDAGLLGASTAPILLPRAVSDAFFRDSIASRGVALVDTPWSRAEESLHFGLGIWIDCDDYALGSNCIYLGSGANGTTAWIDPESQHAAALVLYQRSPTGYLTGRVLMQRLIPAIRAALR